VAWGDWDGDGDLDLAVGNFHAMGEVNQVYGNDGGSFSLAWESTGDAKITSSAVWGDWDGDGDLDLAVGNGAVDHPEVNQVYENEGGTLSLAWESTGDRVWTTSVAWGDWDGDGDLDLAAGNGDIYGELNQVYQNEGINLSLAWESTGDKRRTTSLAWGDWDGDGDLDLAVGNHMYPSAVNQVYGNDGGNLSLAWESVADERFTNSVAWGDWDGDGDLDLAVGNRAYPGEVNQVYENAQTGGASLGNNPPYVTISRPGVTDDAGFFSTPQIITQTAISITYTLFDPEGDRVSRVMPEFSPNGGGMWLPATSAPGGDGLINLAAAPEGVAHTFVWDTEADQVIKNDNLVFRIRAQPSVGPILWPATDGKSPSFRVAAPQYVRVMDEGGRPISGAEVYHNGQLMGFTNRAGLLNPGPLAVGDSLASLVQQHERPTHRDEHDGWAYRTHLTSIDVEDTTGNTQPFIVSQPEGEQRLIVRRENSLVLFNLLVSIEWDATQAYIDDVELAVQRAADYLYDVTDAQMTFGQVAIYDQARHWTEADVQILAKNEGLPHAYVYGLTDAKNIHLIHVLRFWDGSSARQGDWSQPNGYKTLVHEFGHYGLDLWDEYFGYEKVGGQLGGRVDAFCTGPENRDTETEAKNASIMDYHYTSSELADVGRWTEEWCQVTVQHQYNNGEADWETLLRHYSDEPGKDRWQLITPDQRTGEMGMPVPGPDQVPSALPFPVTTTHNTGDDPEPFPLVVCYDGLIYHERAVVTLARAGGNAMDQGFTDAAEGSLTILGARPVDSLQAVSVDGALSASRRVAQVLADGYLDLSPPAFTAQSNGLGPYLRLWPTTSGGLLDGLRLVVNRTLPGDSLRYILTGPDQMGPWAAIPYDEAEEDHRVLVGFIPAALAGYAGVVGGHDGEYIELNVDYRLQGATNVTQTNLYSNDGNFKLHLDAGSLPWDTVQFLIASPWGLPGPPPSGLGIVGEAYEITASDNVTGLGKPAVLRLHYDTAASEAFEMESLTIYRWDFGGDTWQPLTSERHAETQDVVTTITDLGIYALMGDPIDIASLLSGQQGLDDLCQPGGHKTYLPIITK
jgi:hypothetical protein